MKNDLIKITFTLLFAIMCISARAEYDFKVDGLYYRVISLENLTCACVDEQNTSNNAQKSKYTGDIIIPSTVNCGERVFTVVEVGERAFLLSDITSVKIGESVKVIRRDAFSGCKELQRVVFEDGVNVIEPSAFNGCWKLEYVKLPNTLQKIGNYAFKDCEALSCEIVIPPSCKFVGEGALPISGKYSVRVSEGSTPLTMYKYGLGRLGGETLYIGRNLSSDYQYVGVYEYQDVIFGDSVTIMPECYRSSSNIKESSLSLETEKIRTLIIGKSIAIVPLIEMFDIETIRIRSSLPPKATGFLDKVYLNATLYVPKGSLSAYQNADVWKDFWNIKEVEMR